MLIALVVQSYEKNISWHNIYASGINKKIKLGKTQKAM
jgi:hypothetical protein